MSKHEELRLYADEKLVIQTKIDGLEKTLQTSLQTLISEFSGAGNVLFWGILGPQYEVIQEENDANQSRRFELDSKQRERSNLQSTIRSLHIDLRVVRAKRFRMQKLISARKSKNLRTSKRPFKHSSRRKVTRSSCASPKIDGHGKAFYAQRLVQKSELYVPMLITKTK